MNQYLNYSPFSGLDVKEFVAEAVLNQLIEIFYCSLNIFSLVSRLAQTRSHILFQIFPVFVLEIFKPL